MKQIEYCKDIPENQISLERLINEPLETIDRSDKDFSKKALEIHHLGKFLMLLNSGYQISEVREQPDFIIKSADNMLIGVEHEVLVDPNHKKVEGSFASMVKAAEERFRERHPETKILVDIRLNIYKKIRKKDMTFHLDALLSILEDKVFHGRFEKNDLVHNISWVNHSGLTFICNFGAWMQQSMQKDTLSKSIYHKESKRLEYIRNSGIEEQWLLIVIGSLNQSSYIIGCEFEENYTVKSGFNRIFLMEDFKGRLFEL